VLLFPLRSTADPQAVEQGKGMKSKLRKLLGTIALIFAIVVAIAVIIRFLPEKEKWLLVQRYFAERYGNALLSGDFPKQEKFRGEFIDYVIITDPRAKTVLFSPHENHDIAFIYAPSHTEHDFGYQTRKAIKIANGWYCLE